MLDFDALLAEASLPEETVPICLDGKLVRLYEETKQRVDGRTAHAEPAPGDERLNTPKRKPDPEQADLDALTEQIQGRTVPFLVRAMPRDQFVEFAAQPEFKARQEQKSGEVIPQDRGMNVNTAKFVPGLVRACIADPDVTDDGRWVRLAAVLSSAQMSKLFAVAWTVNQEDREVPFSPSGSPSPRNSATA